MILHWENLDINKNKWENSRKIVSIEDTNLVSVCYNDPFTVEEIVKE